MRNSLISLGKVCARTSLSRTTVYELIGRGLFPKQIQITPNRVAWLTEEVDLWIENRVSDSRTGGSENA